MFTSNRYLQRKWRNEDFIDEITGVLTVDYTNPDF